MSDSLRNYAAQTLYQDALNECVDEAHAKTDADEVVADFEAAIERLTRQLGVERGGVCPRPEVLVRLLHALAEKEQALAEAVVVAGRVSDMFHRRLASEVSRLAQLRIATRDDLARLGSGTDYRITLTSEGEKKS